MSIRKFAFIGDNGYLVEQTESDQGLFAKVTTLGVDGVGIDASESRIVNLGAPVDATDAANKSYVDSLVTEPGDGLEKDGVTMSVRFGSNPGLMFGQDGGLIMKVDDSVDTLDVDVNGVKVVGLPALFKIAGVNVGSSVTSANLDTLSDGSDASSLHSHERIQAAHITSVSLSTGDAVAWSSTSGKVVKADADSDPTCRVIGIAAGPASANGTVVVVKKGVVPGVLTGATPGAPVYLAQGGGLTFTIPSVGRIIRVGFAASATDLEIAVTDYGRRSGVTSSSATDLDMQTYRIVNLADPVANQDAATKAYVDAAVASGGSGGGAPTGASYLVLSTNVGLSNERVVAAGTGISTSDGGSNGAFTISHAQVSSGDLHQDYVLASGSRAMSGALNMGSNKVYNLANPSFAQDAATKAYVDSSVSNKATTTYVDNAVFPLATSEYVTEQLALKASTSYVDSAVSGMMKADGSVSMTGNLNMNSSKIFNLATPSFSGDAATKGYVDTQLSSKASTSYVDSAVAAVVNSAPAVLDTLKELADALGNDASFSTTMTNALAAKASTSYVDSAVANYVKKDGTIAMTGALEMGSNRILMVATPLFATDAATKGYVDSADANFIKKDGSVAMTGALAMGSNKVTGLATPTASTDAATKGYADGLVTNLASTSYVDTQVATKAGLGANTFTGTQTGGDNVFTQWMMKDIGGVFVDKGTTSGSSTVTFDYTAGSHQKLTIGASSTTTFAVSNWPPSGNSGQLLIELVNGKASGAAITWPTVNWIKSDGTTTTTFASNGVTLQTTGTDFVVLWTRDGGTTIYGKIIR